MSPELTGDTAVVTGAAQGIGYAIAEKLATEGASIFLCDKDEDGVEKAATELRADDHNVEAVHCDVTNRDHTEALIEAAMQEYGTVDILVNNAGIGSHGSFTELSPTDWDDVIDVNLTGVFNCTYAAVPEMIDNGGGAIINIASMAGRNISYHGAANYTASKWGVVGFTKHLAWDLGEHDIRVNAVCPGSTLTELTKETTTEADRKETTDKIPLGRWAHPEDQAEAVAYLASEAGSYLTGTVLEVDGGKQLSVRHEI